MKSFIITKNTLFLIIVLTVIISSILSTNSHSHNGKKCGFSQVKHQALKMVDTSSKYQTKDRFLQNTNESIRIYVDYGPLDAQAAEFTQAKVDKIKQIINESVGFFSKILKVERLTKKLLLPSACDGISNASEIVLEGGTGVDADIIVFPFFDKTAGDSLEAYASSCYLDSNTNRPIAGIIGFSPTAVNTDKLNWKNYYSMLVIHEMTHIFVFNSSLFEYFKDANGDPMKVTDKITVNGKERDILVTPKVVEEARKHFGCSTLKGVELENQGGDATALSHWESRVMLGDYMIGESYNEVVLSRISLALFEDSNWYTVNYYDGGLFRYGLLEGCSFLEDKCVNNDVSNYPEYFCETPSAEFCYASKGGKGKCLISQYNSIPSNFQYFSNAQWGGNELADYCPIAYHPSDSTPNYFFGNMCNEGEKELTPADMYEVIGADSNCFTSSLIPEGSTTEDKPLAICYKTKCNITDKTYTVTINDKEIICPEEGGKVCLNGYKNHIECYPFNKICTQTVECNNALDCVNKNSEAVLTAKSGKSPVELVAGSCQGEAATDNNTDNTNSDNSNTDNTGNTGNTGNTDNTNTDNTGNTGNTDNTNTDNNNTGNTDNNNTDNTNTGNTDNTNTGNTDNTNTDNNNNQMVEDPKPVNDSENSGSKEVTVTTPVNSNKALGLIVNYLLLLSLIVIMI